MKKILTGIVGFLAFAAISFLLFYKFWFLRLPDRAIPFLDDTYVSPANGIVRGVKLWNSDSLVITKGDLGALKLLTSDLGPRGWLVSIEMNVHNVHYQRTPIESKVLDKVYVKGAFKNALVHENEYGMRFENEHNIILLESASGMKYKVVQIAGFLARRIEDYLQPGQDLKQGDIMGLIKMGSQVTVLFEEGVDILVKEGDVLIEGESLMAREIQ